MSYPAWSRWERIVDVVPGGTELEPRVKSEEFVGLFSLVMTLGARSTTVSSSSYPSIF